MSAVSTTTTIRYRNDLDHDLFEVQLGPVALSSLSLVAGQELRVGGFVFRIIEEIVPDSPLFCRLVDWTG